MPVTDTKKILELLRKNKKLILIFPGKTGLRIRDQNLPGKFGSEIF